MRSVICVHERFDAIWPFAADYWHKRWQENGGCELYRTEDPDARAHQLVSDPVSVQRLVLLGFPAGPEDLEPFASLEECYHESQSYPKSQFNLSAKVFFLSFFLLYSKCPFTNNFISDVSSTIYTKNLCNRPLYILIAIVILKHIK